MHFTLGPELLQFEMMMTLIPKFPLRRCGVRVPAAETAPEDITHDELILNTMRYIRNPAFQKRLNEYLIERRGDTMNYRDAKYQSLFHRELQKRENPTAAMLCALYLLTADCRLWFHVRKSVQVSGIHFQNVILGDISPEAKLYS